MLLFIDIGAEVDQRKSATRTQSTMTSRRKTEEDLGTETVTAIGKIVTRTSQDVTEVAQRIDEDGQSHATTTVVGKVVTTEDVTATVTENVQKHLRKSVAGRFPHHLVLSDVEERHRTDSVIATTRLLKTSCQRNEMRAQFSACSCRSASEHAISRNSSRA